ncbi:MAG: hypothetical protein EOL87_07415 [Spartobacteria bacterium]|nr:hypothetical protein [Spartobacteria bacterium]
MKKPKKVQQEKKEEFFTDDPHFKGEKLFSVGGGHYVQFNGEGPLPDEIVDFIRSTSRKPPFMLLPEMPVDFYLSKGISGASKVHWTGRGALPPAVMAYLHDHGTLPRTRENNEDGDEDEEDPEEDLF